MSYSKYVEVKLGTDNWQQWSVLIKQLLVLEGCWSAVSPDAPEGSAPRTRGDKASEGEVDASKNARALALIITHVEPFHLTTAGAATSAKELWEQFKETYQAKSVARQFQLRQELMTLRMAGNEPVTKFIERARGLWSDLTATGHEMKETELCWAVLMGLPKSFEVMKTILMANAQELSISSIFPQLLQAEQQAAHEEELVPLYAAMSAMRVSKQRKCYYCNQPGHVRATCRKKQQDDAKNNFTVAF